MMNKKEISYLKTLSSKGDLQGSIFGPHIFILLKALIILVSLNQGIISTG